LDSNILLLRFYNQCEVTAFCGFVQIIWAFAVLSWGFIYLCQAFSYVACVISLFFNAISSSKQCQCFYLVKGLLLGYNCIAFAC